MTVRRLEGSRYLTLLTTPTNTAFSTLANLKTMLGITDAGSDAYLTLLLTEASERLAHELGRPYRAQWKERFAGTGSKRFVASRYPVASLDAVTRDDAAEDLTNYVIEDREAGFIYSSTGFGRTDDPTIWEVTYTAGYFMPDDVLTSSAVSADGTLETFASSALFHPLLKAEDEILTTGFVESGNAGNHVLSAATASLLTTRSDLTTESVGVAVTVEPRPQLPAKYQRAALTLAGATYSRAVASYTGVSSVKQGDITVAFHDQDVQDAASGLLTPGWD
jgi:hypothetical protein